MILLGLKVKDKVTGLTGITVGRAEYLNGCIQYCIKPPAEKNKEMKGVWVDEGQCEVIGDGILPKKKSKGPGGPMNDCPRA